MSDGFDATQQEYLKGLFAGLAARRGASGPSPGGGSEKADPADLMRAAQDRVIAAGGKLTPEEQAKRARHPIDRLDEVAARAAEGRAPKGVDVFLTKYHGLFHVAPAQDSFMCRLRLPGGIVRAAQLRGLADLADDLAAGHADVTTRANLQVREIPARNAAEVLNRLAELGLTSRGAGADNVRNVTGSPTAGVDPDELIDTRPHARAIHFHILNHRALYGLPRKFNIAFDGGGRVPVLEETNDVAFSAVRVADGFGPPPGVWYRLGLGGVTGHRDLARDTGVIVDPAQTTRVCDAVLKVFIAEGDRTARNRARLKYVLDRLGVAEFLARVEAELGETLVRVDPAAFASRPGQDRMAHVGVHAQAQPGLSWIGVLLPQARMTSARMRGLADVADRFGSGVIRLTVWQNLLISDVADVPGALAAIHALGLATEASHVRAGLVSCTGSAGCKFALAATKAQGAALADYLDARIEAPAPVNIHVTGCPNSCAQHFVADIGLMGARVDRGEDAVDGYDLHVGGGAGADAAIGRLIQRVAADEMAPMILALLRAWSDGRGPGESFQAWSARHDEAALRGFLAAEAVAA
jgi:ferredoxin-nitrite reductase